MSEKLDEHRINIFIDTIMKVAQGDYTVQIELSEEYSYLDALAIGINMLVDDLNKGREVEKENERITLLNQQLIEAKEKAEESDRLKSAFLANMSHEIRTPMNGILGFADLLKTPELTGEQQTKYIEIIQKSGVRMLNIINDLIDISKVESGLVTTSITETNINEQIESIYTFFKPEAEKKNMILSFKNTLSKKDCIINTDQEKFYAILINLVKNAIKYSNSGNIAFGYEKKGNFIEFYVKDTGIGIAKKHHQSIFNRFVQTNTSLSSGYEGAGLGLAISKAYVEILGGKIWVESEANKGSHFYFTLPYNHEIKEKIIPKKLDLKLNEDKKIGDLKILIVEDDESSEQLISIATEKFSKETLIARNGIEGVELCRKNPDIDLILMDMRMPEMDGFEATKQIREFNKKVIIIAQTAFGMSNDKERTLAVGCNDYISKPIDPIELNNLITAHFMNRNMTLFEKEISA